METTLQCCYTDCKRSLYLDTPRSTYWNHHQHYIYLLLPLLTRWHRI